MLLYTHLHVFVIDAFVKSCTDLIVNYFIFILVDIFCNLNINFMS